MKTITLTQAGKSYTATVAEIFSVGGLIRTLYHRHLVTDNPYSRQGPRIVSTTEAGGVTTLVVSFGCWARVVGSGSKWMADDDVIVTIEEAPETVEAL